MSLKQQSKSTRLSVCLVSCLLVSGLASGAQRYQRQGLAVDFDWRASTAGQARFRFHIHDTVTGAPVLGAYPAAWLHPGDGKEKSAQECRDQAEIFVGGSLFSRAAVDLNIYYVLTMNDDASLSVVDPLFGFGGSKLLNLISLPAPAHDWQLTGDGRYLWLTMPEAKSIARLDTYSWRLETLQLQQKPSILALPDDEQQLWAAVDNGVVAIDPTHLTIAAKVALPGRPTDLLISNDSARLYTISSPANSLSLIDTTSKRVLKRQLTSEHPVALAYSQLAQALYVVGQGQGLVQSFDPHDLQQLAQMQSSPGIERLRFSPSGRWGFLVNPKTDRLSIIDTASNRIVQVGKVESEPDDVVFSDRLAYIRHRNSETLLMVALDDPEIGRPGAPIPVVDAPGGDLAPGRGASNVATSIVQAPGASAVLIANPGDKAVYFYKEGMAAPMGQFNNYGRSPKAVLAIDRSLQDASGNGVYQTVAKLPEQGKDFDVVFFIDSPRLVHCFKISLPNSTETVNPSVKARPKFKALSAEEALEVGKPTQLNFQWLEAQAIPEQDLTVEISLSSGHWRQQQTRRINAQGILEISFTPPARGLYRLDYAPADSSQFSPLGQVWYQVQ